jgi:uncharacterized protein with FMN-binding domain
MKKALISAFVIATFGAYCWFARNEQNVPKTPTTNTTAPAAATLDTTTTQASTSTYKDGDYTGKAFNAYYGDVQIHVSISGGKLADIEFLQYPQDRRESMEINQTAMPVLKQEAIQAQTAHIDGVSGATDTSEAFIKSLDSALTLAHS